MPKNWKGGPFEVFQHPFCRKTWKNWRIFFYFRDNISQCRKKLKGGTLWDFPTSILSQNIKKNAGGPFGEKNFPEKKSRSAEKNWKGGPFGLAGYICYAGKQEKPFWFSSLDQIVPTKNCSKIGLSGTFLVLCSKMIL